MKRQRALFRLMGTRERPADRGRRRTGDAFRRLGQEHRDARVAAGLSLRDAAAGSGAAYTQLWRFERGQLDRVNIADVGAWCAVVGLDLAIRAYPAGDPIRDRAQLALLERLRSRLHPTLRWRIEVPLPIEGDLRAWDAEIVGRQSGGWRARVEAETRISDGQALERRLALKVRDDPAGHLILLVSDTRANRAALRSLRAGLRDLLPLRPREIMTALAAGRDPGGSGIVIL
jgi:transcriptional regulator with XRE-family HTH domain